MLFSGGGRCKVHTACEQQLPNVEPWQVNLSAPLQVPSVVTVPEEMLHVPRLGWHPLPQYASVDPQYPWRKEVSERPFTVVWHMYILRAAIAKGRALA